MSDGRKTKVALTLRLGRKVIGGGVCTLESVIGRLNALSLSGEISSMLEGLGQGCTHNYKDDGLSVTVTPLLNHVEEYPNFIPQKA